MRFFTGLAIMGYELIPCYEHTGFLECCYFYFGVEYFGAFFDNMNMQLVLVGYEMIIANLALRASICLSTISYLTCSCLDR